MKHFSWSNCGHNGMQLVFFGWYLPIQLTKEQTVRVPPPYPEMFHKQEVSPPRPTWIPSTATVQEMVQLAEMAALCKMAGVWWGEAENGLVFNDLFSEQHWLTFFS